MPTALRKFRRRTRSVSPPSQEAQNASITRRYSDRGPPGRLRAQARRNHLFHQLFETVPKDDDLVQEYACALRKNILLQGHMYLAEHHLCFNSSILGYRTKIVLNYSEITRVEKRKTARMFPTGLTISTAQENYIFGSFLVRDQAYAQIIALWKAHQQAQERKPEPIKHRESYRSRSLSPSDLQAMAPIIRTGQPLVNRNLPKPRVTFSDLIEPCQCDAGQHQGVVALDETYPEYTVERMYRLLFMDSDFMYNLMSKGMHCTDIKMSTWKGGKCKYKYTSRSKSGQSPPTYWSSYHNVAACKLPSFASVSTVTRAKHASFHVKTHICITHAKDLSQAVRVLVTSQIVQDHIGLASSILEQEVIHKHRNFFRLLHQALKEPQTLQRSATHSSQPDPMQTQSFCNLPDEIMRLLQRLKLAHIGILFVLVFLLTQISTIYHLVRMTHDFDYHSYPFSNHSSL